MTAVSFLENPWVLLLIILWVAPWKGVALWRAARNKHLRWFIVLLVLNTLAILDIIYTLFFSQEKRYGEKRRGGAEPSDNSMELSDRQAGVRKACGAKQMGTGKPDGLKAHTRRQQKAKQLVKQKILELFETDKKVTNDLVQKAIKVSDATATRYLDELEKEGKIKQIGGSKKDTFYRLKS